MLPFRGVHLFSLTLFLSAALAFVIQPLIAKRLLPLLGGSPAVWNTCLVFFQAALLLGYGLSDRLVRLRPRTQVAAHLTLLALAGAMAIYGWLAPLGEPMAGNTRSGGSWPPFPPRWACRSLCCRSTRRCCSGGSRCLAPPRIPTRCTEPATSAACVGLLAFPFLFEPLLTLPAQGALWGAGFATLLVMVASCGRRVWVLNPSMPRIEPTHAEAEAVSWRSRALWAAVAFVPSSLTIGVTTFISTDLAAVPLLWVIPLALYLLSFAVTFGAKPATTLIRVAGYVYPVLAIGVLSTIHRPTLWPTLGHVVLHPSLLFAVGVIAHGYLASARPHPARLTEFYLWVAIGGVLGGTFNALIAPQIFSSIIEYPLVIALSAFVLPLAWYGAASTLLDVALGIGVGLIALATAAVAQRTMPYGPAASRRSWRCRPLCASCSAIAGCDSARRSPAFY